MPSQPGRIKPFGSSGAEQPRIEAPAADAFDRPLTVPLLVRGALDNGLLRGLFWVAGGLFALGLCAFTGAPRSVTGALVILAGAALVLVPALALLVYLLPRRLWLQVTVTGFVITRPAGEESFGDDQVVGLSRDSSTGQDGSSTHKVVLEVERGGAVARFACRYHLKPNQPDPLASFWDRLAGQLAQRARGELGRGAGLRGPNWSVDARGLHWGGEVVEIRRLRKVGYFDRKLCVWCDDEERPFVALPRGGRNIQPLAVLLWELIQQGPGANAPLPGRPLGRVILDRRSHEWAVALGMVGLFAPVMAYVAMRQLFSPYPGSRSSGLAVGAFFAGLLCLFVAAAVWSWFTRLRFHEYGVVQPGLWGTKVLMYAQIATMTSRGTSRLVFAPAPGSGLPTVRYRAFDGGPDEGLKALRDHVAWILGYRLAERQARGPVVWTRRLRFLPGGLEYRPWQLFGLAPAVSVPYHYTHYELVGEEFHLHVQSSTSPVCKESTGAANFFPGLALLDLVYQGCRPAGPEADRTPAPRAVPPTVGDETRIVGEPGGPSGVTAGE